MFDCKESFLAHAHHVVVSGRTIQQEDLTSDKLVRS